MPAPSPVPDKCCCVALRKAARHVTGHYDRHLALCGLTVTQFSILSHLAGGPHPTIGELAGRLAMDRTTLGRTLRPLEGAGLVLLSPDPADARRRALSLTEGGALRLAAARPLWTIAQERFDAAFGAGPSGQLRAALATVLATDLTSLPAATADLPAATADLPATTAGLPAATP